MKQKKTFHIPSEICRVSILNRSHDVPVLWCCDAPVLGLLIVHNTNETVIRWFAQKAEQISWYNFLLRWTGAAGHVFMRMGNSILWKVIKACVNLACVDGSGMKSEHQYKYIRINKSKYTDFDIHQNQYILFINTTLKVILVLSSSVACYWQLMWLILHYINWSSVFVGYFW